ncbi:cytochrome P450 [Fennellomyces sp. T-0311]|nr:cytochrome P450 [Fennellomyces sp. T-0311]
MMSSIDLSTQQRSIGIITAAAVATGYIFYAWFRAQNDDCPVVPYSNPLTGSSAEYRKNPKEFVEKWTQKLGPVYRVHLFGRLHTVVSGSYAREVFLNDNFSFNAGTAKRFDVALMAGIAPGEVAPDRSRKVIVKFFTPRLKYLTPRATENLSLGLNEMLGNVTKPMEVRHMFPIILRMVARASASIFVGEKLCKDPELVAVFQNITGDIGSMHPRVHQTWMEPFWGLLRLRMWAIGKFSSRVKYYRKKMLDSFTPEIDLRLKNMQDPDWQKPDDVLQSLIEDGAEPGKDLYNYIVSQMMILIFASIHTTSSAGTIVLYRLLENPQLMDEIFQEQEEVLQHLGIDSKGNIEDIFTFQATKQMVKLDSVCRESLRLINRYYDLAHTYIGKNKVALSNGTVIEPGQYPQDKAIYMSTNHSSFIYIRRRRVDKYLL